MMGLRVGEKNRDGYVINEIFEKNDKFAILGVDSKNESNSISTIIHPLDENIETELKKGLTKFSVECKKAECVIEKSHNESATRAKIASIIAKGLNQTLDDSNEDKNFDNIKKLFADITEETTEERERIFISKIRYMFWVFSFTVVFIMFAVLAHSLSCGGDYIKIGECFSIKNIYFYLLAMGSIGCAISASIKVKGMVFESLIEEPKVKQGLLRYLIRKFPVYSYASERVLISVLCAVVSYFALNTKILNLGIEGGNNVYVYLIVACVAGFSEKFIPDFLKTVEKKAKKEEGKNE